jgi:predicted flavoprotein YhiN
MSNRLLDLSKYQSDPARIFAGRDRGASVRDAAQIADFEKSKDDVLEVHVPEGTFAVTSSFFLALFGETIRKLGANGFRDRVKFTGKSIEKVVDQAIWEALEALKPFSLA